MNEKEELVQLLRHHFEFIMSEVEHTAITGESTMKLLNRLESRREEIELAFEELDDLL